MLYSIVQHLRRRTQSLFRVEDCIAFMASSTSRKLTDAHEKRLAPAGITRAQWLALHHITQHEEITQRELAALMGSRQPAATRLLDRMEKEGLVARIRKDRRANSLRITQKGAELYTRGLEITEAYRDEVTRGISAEDIDIFKSVLSRLSQNVDLFSR